LKKAGIKLLIIFTLVMVMCWSLSGIAVYGGSILVLLDDTGSSAGSWSMLDNRVASVSWLDGGPSSGNPGEYYYFTNTSGGRDVGSAQIQRDAMFNADQKILSNLGQLKVDFYMDIAGWSGDADRVAYYIYSLKGGVSTELFYSGNYSNDTVWRAIGKENLDIPKDSDGIRIKIVVLRVDGSDLDVYLDNIRLYLHEETLPVMTGATVTGIRDCNNTVIPLKIDEGGQYLDNWVNTTDTILGKIDFNEPVTVSDWPYNLNSNIVDVNGNMKYGNVGDGSGSFSYSHDYRIPLTGADRLKEGDSTVKFVNNPYDGHGPFEIPVHDLGGNYGQSDVMKPNIDSYNIKLDNASPTITTPWDSYETYVKDRTSVDIVVCEENRGTEQSPLTLTYFWEYINTNNIKVTEPEKEILISSTVVPVEDDTNTIYTVKIDIPNGSNIPPYQDFWLSADVNDEARNPYSNRCIYCKVNQKDGTPPVVTWDRSIHEDGTIVNLSTDEDAAYTTSRTVSFSAQDLESGVEDLGSDFGGVKYLWTKEPYNPDSDIITKRVFPVEGSKYIIQGTSDDASMEGMYYLSILAENTTGTNCAVSKGFYFDNEAPRATEAGSMDWNPMSAQYQVSDRALQNKFLYTILAGSESSITGYEPIVEPDISEGLKDDGMWKVLDLCGTGYTDLTANITGVLDKITQSGNYKLVTRYYDEFFNCAQVENVIWYDFIAPDIEVVDAGEPGIFGKNHSIVLEVVDNLSIVDLSEENLLINWIDADSGEAIPVKPEIEPQLRTITIRGSEAFDGKYYLKVRASDAAGNIMDKMVFVNGSRAEFCFDNSPPKATLACYTEKPSRTVRFAYSELKDDYTGVALARYGISNTPDGEPSKWIEIDSASGIGEIIYPDAFTSDGNWYLSVLLRDTLGNEQSIRWPDPFRIDVTNPSGSIGFVSGHTSKLDVPLQLIVDELKSIEQGTFKTILSSDGTKLSDAAIGSVLPTDWKDISYENGSAIYSWTLSDTIDGEQQVYARFMDEAGNISGIYEASIILDRTAPTGEINYDITTPAAGNVTATLTMSDNYNVALLNNNQINTYVFNRNGEFEFVLRDEAGNKTRIKAVVSNIDRDPPKAAITYSLTRDIWTNQSVTATLNLTEDNGFVISGDGAATHTFNENGEFVFRFEDALGNQGSMKAEVKNIDKAKPSGSIIYTHSETAPVTVYLSVNEPVEVTNNAGSFRYVFDENGAFTFEFEDKAGNAATATAIVDTITSLDKYVNVNYSDSGRLTNENISAEFTPLSDWAEITSPTVTEEVYGSYTYNFTENGDCPVVIRVFSGEEEGSIRTVAGSVYNIDRVPPTAEVYIRTEEPTNQNVTATLLPYDDKGKAIAIVGGASEHVFAENGTFTFDFMDEAGNIGHKAITVSNIDKSVPVAAMRYYTVESKANSVFAELSFPGETDITILNNNGSNTFEFVENGAFTFKYADKAGNAGYATAQVTSLSDGVSAGTIEYYIEGIKADDINGVTTNKNVTAKLVLDESGGPCTIVNNGGSSTYTFLQNGEFTFIYEDSKKNRGFARAMVSTIDKELPTLQILADITRATNQDITITVNYGDNKGISKVMVNGVEVGTNPEGKFTYTCTENKKIQVMVFDSSGNTTTREFEVDYIDKVAPIGTIVYTPNSMTNQDVKAVLTLNETGLILNNSGKMEYTFIQNGEFTFEFADIAGNSTTMTASVNWIDKTLPAASLKYSNTQMTNKPVTVTLNTEADAVILNNGGAAARTFYTNGEFTFRVVDIAGNQAGIKAVVANIDVEKPQITLKGNADVSIMQNEAYTEAGYSAVDNVDGDITGKVAAEGSVNTGVPGIYILKYKVSDAVGNPCEVSRTIRVIGPDEIVLVLNGILTDGEQVIINDNNINIDCIGNEGSCILKWAEGKRTQAYFKSEGNIIAVKGTVSLANNSWYTFFIQDRERKTKCIQVYINE